MVQEASAVKTHNAHCAMCIITVHEQQTLMNDRNSSIDTIHVNGYPMNIRINCFHYCSKDLIGTVKLNCTEINMINNLTFTEQENRNIACCQKFRITRNYEAESRRILTIDQKSYLTRLECKMMLGSEAKFSLNASTTITLYRPHDDTLDKLNCSVIKPPIQDRFEIKLQWISPSFQLGPIVSTPYVEVYVGAPGVYTCKSAMSYVGGSKKFMVFHDETIDIPAAREGGLINDGRAIYIVITVAAMFLLIPIIVVCRKIRKEKRQRSRMRKRSRCHLHKHYPNKSKSNLMTATASNATKTGK